MSGVVLPVIGIASGNRKKFQILSLHRLPAPALVFVQTLYFQSEAFSKTCWFQEQLWSPTFGILRIIFGFMLQPICLENRRRYV